MVGLLVFPGFALASIPNPGHSYRAIGGGSSGLIPFFDPNGILSQDSQFVWDATNTRLGIGISTPGESIDTSGTIRSSTQFVSSDGSATVPSYGFSTPDFGMYYDAGNNELAFTAGTTIPMMELNNSSGISFGAPIVDNLSQPVFDLNNRLAFGSGGEMIDWNNAILFNSGNPSVDWANAILLNTWVADGFGVGTGNPQNNTGKFQVQGPDTPGTGTILPSGTSVVGTGTFFTTELQIGELLSAGGVVRRITSITDDTHLTVNNTLPTPRRSIPEAFTFSRASLVVDATTGEVGIGTLSPSQELEVNGGMRLNTTTSEPTCDATVRGTFWFTQGGTGVKDAVEVCAKDAADAYAWRTIY